MSYREPAFEWTAPSSDPNDRQFGDVVESIEFADADDYDAVIVGEPFDDAVIGRTGAAEGPTAIRERLAATKTHHFDADPVGSIGDLGDLGFAGDAGDPLPETVAEKQDHLQRFATRKIHASDALPVFLGGDNSLTYPNAAPLLDRGSLGVVNFDAHLDVREVRDGPTSGTPYRQLFEAGLDAYACIGARHFETSSAYADYVDERGGEVVTAEEVGEDPVVAAELAMDAMGDLDALYVSVDLDVLDESAAPGVSAPTPGGLSTRELYRAVRLMASDDRLAGFEIVECAPPLDRGGRTVDAAARAVAHGLAGYLEVER
ncbi:formimidoylglutamase [Saliphagus sp. LR7]|uniref:formimidoylglutamase n=1 Tax=Saliphagus sp. LR7 TaxID=2282654 RepID=UPI000DF7C131|nr:formimidoylglutamase [Saliphagus sp. LR7]